MPTLATPNLFHLSGAHVHVTYASSGVDGKAHLTYQDAAQTLTFAGDQIRAVATDAGTLLSVTLRMTVDSGSTSFSLLIPRTQVPVGESAPIHTLSITALHRFSVVPAFNQGQLDTYATQALHGNAQHVEF